jgi:hypothetical protein
LIRQKKEIRRAAIVIIFISLVLASNVTFFNQSSLTKTNEINETVMDELLFTSDLNVNDDITGTGTNQDVRIYVSNESENLNSNQEFFAIPSVVTDDMFLTYGDFNFTFQNNYTTDYVIEDDDALYAADFISFDYNTGFSGITYNNGDKLSGGFADLYDGSNSTSILLNATLGLLNVTIDANFNDTTYTSVVMNGNVEFNRSKILGLISSLVFSLSLDANLTVNMRDYSQSTWKEIITALPINSSLGRQEIKRHVINENLDLIDLSNTCYVQFIFEREDNTPFTGRLYEYELQSTYAFDLPITDQEYVALEFDLKGEESAVNGFYAWIRTLDPVEAATSQLNITLYRSNASVVRTNANLRNIMLGPDYSDMIDSQLVSYTNDTLSYFEFNTINTGRLNLSNYFVVINSTNSKEVYSLVSLPFFDYGDDGQTEHQLKTTINDGSSWDIARKTVVTDNWPYVSGQLDASSFKLNVTRGYMPSDFTFNNNNTLRIQNMTIENVEISSSPYNESSYLTWGLGRWDNSFIIPIEDTPANEFEVYLQWNKSIINGFEFNATYNINAYWVDTASANYIAVYDEDPEWILTYIHDNNDPKFNNWNFFEFWYIYPDYMNAHNLTNPNDEEFLWKLDGESVLTENPNELKLMINESYSTLNGIYTLNLTSYNFIRSMHSYIDYNGILWETNGFMYGDNVTASVNIQDHHSNAPLGGTANSSLFYPNGTVFTGAELIDSLGVINGLVLSFDFDNATILELTKDLTVFGKYSLGFFWFNGSAIGCKKLTVYIDTYDVQLDNLTYLPNLQKNVLIGELNNKVFQNYSLLIGSINETTGLPRPNFYPINNSDVNQEFIYNLGGQDLSILIESFLQSENILNSGEIVNFKAVIKNTHAFIPFDVKMKIQLVSYTNDNWVIAEQTSNTINLNFSGHPDDTHEFDANLTIPSYDSITKTWKGVNAPIRMGGAKALITLFIDNTEVGTYESPDYSLLSIEQNNLFEGHLLGLKISDEVTSRSIFNEFDRDECIYLPNATSFLVNIIDTNYISSYQQFKANFTLKLNSKFTNISTSRSIIRDGESFYLNSLLTTEFGEELTGKNVTCQYYGSGTWSDIGSALTDANGFTSFFVDTLGINFEENLMLRLSWDGDIVNSVSKNVSIDIIHDINDFSISISKDAVFIYKNGLTTLSITIQNTGKSILKFHNISVSIAGNLQYAIVEINYIELSWMNPGDGTKIIIEISVPETNKLNFSFSITAQNIITDENITISEQLIFTVNDPPILDYIVELFMFIMIGFLVVLWVVSVFYSRRIKRRIEAPVEEEEVRRRPRKGRYVPVAELKKPTPEKPTPKKKAKKVPEEPAQKKTTDLDSLLEERGLADKKKKLKK